MLWVYSEDRFYWTLTHECWIMTACPSLRHRREMLQLSVHVWEVRAVCAQIYTLVFVWQINLHSNTFISTTGLVWSVLSVAVLHSFVYKFINCKLRTSLKNIHDKRFLWEYCVKYGLLAAGMSVCGQLFYLDCQPDNLIQLTPEVLLCHVWFCPPDSRRTKPHS